jgi:hypothetical protein
MHYDKKDHTSTPSEKSRGTHALAGQHQSNKTNETVGDKIVKQQERAKQRQPHAAPSARAATRPPHDVIAATT